MNRVEFVPKLEEVLEIDPGTLHEEEEIRNLKHWDSLKLLEIIALADEQLHVQVNADHLAKCITVRDLLELIENATMIKNM
jgi:acyl carrier protein